MLSIAKPASQKYITPLSVPLSGGILGRRPGPKPRGLNRSDTSRALPPPDKSNSRGRWNQSNSGTTTSARHGCQACRAE